MSRTRKGAYDKPCDVCGSPIFFARSEEGRPIPFDASRTVVALPRMQEGGRDIRITHAHIPHFITCDDPKKAKRKAQKRKQSDQQEADF